MDLGGVPPPAPDAARPPEAGVGPGDGGVGLEVSMFALAYSPRDIAIARGTTVRWVNRDSVEHTVTEGSPEATTLPLFDSGLVGPGGTFQWTFQEAGEWLYYCKPHENVMRDSRVSVQ